MTDLKSTPVAVPAKAPPPHAAPDAPKAETVIRSWQYDGSSGPTGWPDWLNKHGATIADSVLRLSTPGGLITVVKGEWVIEDGKGAVRVTKDALADKKH